EKGVPIARAKLADHLRIFDANDDGKIGLMENYWGWRASGYSIAKAIKQTAASAVVFGVLRLLHSRTNVGDALPALMGLMAGQITIDKINSSRPSGATGIYDKNGMIDEAKLGPLLEDLQTESKHGVLSKDDAWVILRKHADLGTIPNKQWD